MAPDRTVRAAGGVLWRQGESGPEVAVVHRPRYDDWSLPKGKLDDDEPHLSAAIREIREETGYDGVAGVRLGSTSYDVSVDGRRVPKVVQWWSVQATGGGFAPGREVDELRWLRPAQARALLGDDGVLARWCSLPLAPALVLLVRHASAGDASSWRGDDDLRPLDDKGIRQTALVTRVLHHYAPTRVLSAPPVRCQDTVRPLADLLGLPVELDPLVGEQDAPARPERHVSRLAQPGTAVVVCSQGGVIPRVVGSLDASLQPVAASKGSLWVLAFSDGVLLSADPGCLR
jgi:8-oxo-dGTP diphosphatase